MPASHDNPRQVGTFRDPSREAEEKPKRPPYPVFLRGIGACLVNF